MKKYIVFYGDNYYPSGGSQDLHKFFETEKECQDFILKDSQKNRWSDMWYCYLDIEKDVTKCLLENGKFKEPE